MGKNIFCLKYYFKKKGFARFTPKCPGKISVLSEYYIIHPQIMKQIQYLRNWETVKCQNIFGDFERLPKKNSGYIRIHALFVIFIFIFGWLKFLFLSKNLTSSKFFVISDFRFYLFTSSFRSVNPSDL